MMRHSLALWVSLSLLSACGGSDPVATPEPEPPVPTVPEINSAQAIPGKLVQSSAASFERYLKNGIYSRSAGNGVDSTDNPPPVPTLEFGEGSGDRSFSQTNTAEAGVDEADRIEYNGDFLFIATQPVWNGTQMSSPGVRVMQRNADFSMSQVNDIAVESDNANINGMYLYQDNLSVVSSGYPFMTLMDIATTSLFAPHGGWRNSVEVNFFDVSTPAEASEINEISVDGWLVASRRIGQYVYLVTAYNPYVELPHPYPEDDAQRIANYQYLQSVAMTDLMPDIRVNGVASEMNAPEDCYIPEQATEADGYANLITVTRINVNQSQDVQSICMSTYADISYMSTESLYLAAHLDDGMALHKIDVAEQFSYAASGEVSGYLWGRDGTPQLRMSEADGYFRIVTSQWTDEGPVHQLSVLQQDADALQLVAQLPNDEQPEAIGKPNEDIYAVRFIQDRAYIVTFERIDPLYVIDLSSPTAPFVAGALEVPGFSSYLHPLDNGYLLGVGQDVEEMDLPGTGETPRTIPVTTGVKVSLFDVSDPANPTELSSVSFEDTYTPVEYDYKALSVLQTGSQYQFAMPLEAWLETEVEGDTGSGDEAETTTIWMPHNSLLMLDVNANSGAGDMQVVNRMTVENDPEAYVWSGEDRSVIHGENVFYVHGNQVWHSLWADSAEVTGPY
ncbi:beta-propeller domain-containing protein [Planctobacterium marinum]|uniref:beta-propeller domain-containing protein n=1 Tax=Planctobacterium marinum TaxID=1631968 RepID=UPI001E42A099|nr:beta-propeller domain-containing protein [Planctobacterium marinum]MCC2607857.1 beta-propeller domain-containing protein [Planctobacterium marinum]